jgi:CheY-like chemotaxis protein
VNKLLLVDADPLRLSVLDVGLRQSGYDVTIAGDGAEALDKMEWDAPDVVVTDTHLPMLDGFALVQTLKKHPELAVVPVVFLASEPSEADEKHAMDLGADDYLPRPVYVRDLAARIRMLLANRARESADAQLFSAPAGRGWSNGSTRDLALADLLQDIYVARATGVVRLRSGAQEAQVFFRDGNVVDAQLGHLRGEEAVYRALLWDNASFDVKFKPVLNEDVIHCATPTLVMRGMDRVDEWLRLCARAEPLAAMLDVTPPRLLARLSALGEIPERLNAMALPPAPRDSHPERLKAAPSAASSSMRGSEAAHQIVGPDLQTTMILGSGRPDLRMRIVVPRDVIPAAPAAEAVQATATPELSSPPPTSEPEHPSVGSDLPTTMVTGSADSDLGGSFVLPRDVIPPAPDAEAVEPIAAQQLRASPSSPPWTVEANAGAEPAYDADVHAEGVPRALGKGTKRIGGALVGVAAVLGMVMSLHSVRNRQIREAERARGANAVAVLAVPSVLDPYTKPAAVPAAKGALGEASSLEKPFAEASGGVSGVPEALAPAPPATPPKDVGAAASPAAIAPPPAVREMFLDTRLAIDSHSPLVRDAQRLLLKGDTAHATEVAQKAVSSDPSDADAWLTLAAARLAAGDGAGAADAYSACIAQAQTVGITHCRVFAQRFPATE